VPLSANDVGQLIQALALVSPHATYHATREGWGVHT